MVLAGGCTERGVLQVPVQAQTLAARASSAVAGGPSGPAGDEGLEAGAHGGGPVAGGGGRAVGSGEADQVLSVGVQVNAQAPQPRCVCGGGGGRLPRAHGAPGERRRGRYKAEIFDGLG